MALRYYAGFDIALLGTASMTTTGVASTPSLTTGTYAHVTMAGVSAVSGYTAFAAALDSALHSSFTVTFDPTAGSTGAYTISNASAFQITAISTTMARILGFDYAVPTSSATSIASNKQPHYLIVPEIAARSFTGSGDYEGGTIAYDAEADDGTSTGVARTTAAKYNDWTQVFEPHAKVQPWVATAWTNIASTSNWTYYDLFTHCRNVQPIYVKDSFSGLITGDDMVVKLRDDGCAFVPRPEVADFTEQWNIDFKTRVLGRV